MASVFKPAGKSKYVIFYTDENGRRRKKTAATDKAVSERIARDIENRVALVKEGIVDVAAEAYRDHEARPLADHISEWQADLVAKRPHDKHAEHTTEPRAGDWQPCFSDLSPSAFDPRLLRTERTARQMTARLVDRDRPGTTVNFDSSANPGGSRPVTGRRIVSADLQPLSRRSSSVFELGLEERPNAERTRSAA